MSSCAWPDCLITGLLFGVAFLMKQPGMFFGLFGGFYLAWTGWAGKMPPRQILARLGVYSLGCLLPFLAVCLWLELAGVFPEFWFWTISYAREYVALLTFHEGVARAGTALAMILQAAPLLWLLAGLGLVCLAITPRAVPQTSQSAVSRVSQPAEGPTGWPVRPTSPTASGGAPLALNTRIFLAGFLLFSGLAVCPGLYFRRHYFIVLLPAVALIAGLAVSQSARGWAKKSARPGLAWLPFVLAALAGAQSLYADRAVLFRLPPIEACRAVYGTDNPFPESAGVARHLAQLADPDQPVAVIGSEPQIYFYAHRRSATRFIYTFPLMEAQPFARTMQEDMIRELEQNPPAALVFVAIPTSWLAGPDSSPLLLNWVNDYTARNMRRVGLIQYTGGPEPEAVWGPAAAAAAVRSPNYLAVFQRLTADELLAKYTDEVRRHPDDADAHNHLGIALGENGRLDEAIRQFQEALRLKPEDLRVQNNLAKALELKNAPSRRPPARPGHEP